MGGADEREKRGSRGEGGEVAWSLGVTLGSDDVLCLIYDSKSENQKEILYFDDVLWCASSMVTSVGAVGVLSQPGARRYKPK